MGSCIAAIVENNFERCDDILDSEEKAAAGANARLDACRSSMQSNRRWLEDSMEQRMVVFLQPSRVG